jgi:GNAT superfamily N-acetyltransferase
MPMSAVGGDKTSSVSGQVTLRWQAADPLLPAVWPPSPDCGAELVVAGSGGQPAAVGICEHWEGAPGSLDLTWGAARRFQLTAQVAGPDVADGLDQLLSLWRDHLADVPGSDEQDTAAVVNWPSRDVHGVAPLLRHGLAPLAVVAARTAGRGAAGLGPPADETALDGVLIRRAGPADIDAVVLLGLEVVRFDAHFGSVNERPNSAEALRKEAFPLLAGLEPWVFLAERDGRAIGLLYAERPESATWIAPMTGASPVTYLMLMAVVPTERRAGVGAALVAQFHREADAAGVAVALLHYEQLNPLSAPFWGQQGYRPLWSTWEVSPARAIR